MCDCYYYFEKEYKYCPSCGKEYIKNGERIFSYINTCGCHYSIFSKCDICGSKPIPFTEKEFLHIRKRIIEKYEEIFSVKDRVETDKKDIDFLYKDIIDKNN